MRFKEKRYKRIIVRDFINGDSKSFNEIGLLDNTIIGRVWTLYDEDRMWTKYKFNAFTGQPINRETDLNDLILVHHEGVFLEDIMHDWTQRKNVFRFFGHSGSKGDKHDLLIEFE